MKALVLLIIIGSGVSIHAQTTGEWYNQNKTQQKYLLQQIAAFKLYAGYLAGGYTIAHEGLDYIKQVKQGDFSIHSNFIRSLVSVNPAIKKYAGVGDIVSLQAAISKKVQQATLRCSKGSFTPDEITYLHTVFNNLLEEGWQILGQLLHLLTRDDIQLKDDQRLRQVNDLLNEVREQYCFAQSFCNAAFQLSLQRQVGTKEIGRSKRLLGIY